VKRKDDDVEDGGPKVGGHKASMSAGSG